MSQENVEIVRGVYAEWGRGNMRAGTELFDPEIVFEGFLPDSKERVVVHQPDGIETFMREWLAQWRDFRLFAEEFRQINDDCVFVEGHQTATGRQGGVPVEAQVFSVWRFREGKLVHLVFERDRQKALQAAGLTE